MTSFLIAIGVLLGGYFLYGLLMDKIIGVDPKRAMPAFEKQDGIDYIPMPTWKVFLIQFLNIAGLGPIFGAIMGILFGPAAFLWIVLGTIFAGAVHDYLSGMMSIRSGGQSLPEIVGHELGLPVKYVMRIFSLALLVLVVAVFITTPASLLATKTAEATFLTKEVWIVIIFLYYLAATLLPIDKIIGNIYPIFGVALLFMAAGLLCVLLFGEAAIPDGFADGLYSRDASQPIFPMMFVTIACGAISGFHATQSPMMARCLKNEKLARPVFYGAMVTEGLVALIWAAAAITFTGGYEQLAAYKAEAGGAFTANLVNELSSSWLGTVGGILALLGVIAAPISTGDTALRSARLITADFFKIDQKSTIKRLLVTLPLTAIVVALMFINFDVLWRYFAWSNQTLAVFTLWAVTVYLGRHRKAFIVTLIPALFMTAVSMTYLFYAPDTGICLSLSWSILIGSSVGMILLALFLVYLYRIRTGRKIHDPGY